MFTTVQRWLLPFGCAALAVSLCWAFMSKGRETGALLDHTRELSEELARYRIDLAPARASLAAAEKSLEAVNREAAEAEGSLQSLRSSDSRLAGDAAAAADAIDRQVELVRQKIEVRQATLVRKVQSPPTPAPAPARSKQKERVDEPGVKQVEERLTRYRDSIVVLSLIHI